MIPEIMLLVICVIMIAGLAFCGGTLNGMRIFEKIEKPYRDVTEKYIASLNRVIDSSNRLIKTQSEMIEVNKRVNDALEMKVRQLVKEQMVKPLQ